MYQIVAQTKTRINTGFLKVLTLDFCLFLHTDSYGFWLTFGYRRNSEPETQINGIFLTLSSKSLKTLSRSALPSDVNRVGEAVQPRLLFLQVKSAGFSAEVLLFLTPLHKAVYLPFFWSVVSFLDLSPHFALRGETGLDTSLIFSGFFFTSLPSILSKQHSLYESSFSFTTLSSTESMTDSFITTSSEGLS